MAEKLLGGIAEGSLVWLADGSAVPIEQVAAKPSPVLSYDKPWDTRPVRYGPNQGLRDHSVGKLISAVPAARSQVGASSIVRVSFVSGRVLETALGHSWVTQRRTGRQAWEWKRAEKLEAGDHVPLSSDGEPVRA